MWARVEPSCDTLGSLYRGGAARQLTDLAPGVDALRVPMRLSERSKYGPEWVSFTAMKGKATETARRALRDAKSAEQEEEKW